MSKQPDSTTLLGGLSTETFLSKYWQKKPLLIRNAWPNLKTSISAEELAGLACEENIHARLVQEKHPLTPWHVSYSPFQEKDFLSLPDSHWTLLVTDCEKHLPALRKLIEPFRFIPDWRIDDLMISYAADKGSVGPHIDQYDVFLLQLEGTRHWEINEQALNNPETIDGLELAILENFEAGQRWKINPGDLLYLPPGIPHHGIANGACLTASIGFRAASHANILHDYTDFISAQLNESDRYCDPDLEPQNNPAEITPQAIHKFQQITQSSLNTDEEAFSIWLGKMLTTSDETHGEMEFTENIFTDKLHAEEMLYRSPFARLAFIKSKSQLLLFANGEHYPLEPSLIENVETLCKKNRFTLSDFTATNSEHWNQLLLKLYLQQVIEFES